YNIKLYCTTTLKQHQSQIFSFLDSKKIKYQAVDIAQRSEVKEEMRKKTGNPTALPPQVFNRDVYCGVSLVPDQAWVWTKIESLLRLAQRP
uniref:Zgc:153284 n=1 Tax=Hucho hucho TaxID=62062 RepID=A0A4W5LTN1_9TELE